MRTSVVIAAIGAAAVLGGVTACGVSDARDPMNDRTVELARRVDLLEAQLATMQRAQEVDGEALNRIRIDAMNAQISGPATASWWWCGLHCFRREAQCLRDVEGKGFACDRRRIAYCDRGVCHVSRDQCDALGGPGAVCLGVE